MCISKKKKHINKLVYKEIVIDICIRQSAILLGRNQNGLKFHHHKRKDICLSLKKQSLSLNTGYMWLGIRIKK